MTAKSIDVAGWQERIFNMKVRGQNGPEDFPVSGYTKGLFGLDARFDFLSGERPRKAWCLTHLPTGYTVKYIYGGLKGAAKIADQIAAAADWGFTDPLEAKHRGVAVKQIIDRQPAKFCAASDVSLPVRATRFEALGAVS